MNIFKHFQSGLKKTSNFLSTNIIDALKSEKIDQEGKADRRYTIEILSSMIEYFRSTEPEVVITVPSGESIIMFGRVVSRVIVIGSVTLLFPARSVTLTLIV